MATKRKSVARAKPAPLVWEPVTSETIEQFAYVPSYRDLLLRFRSGGSYVYRDVDPAIVARLRKPHPWHEIGDTIKNHPCERLGNIRTKPLKGRGGKRKVAA